QFGAFEIARGASIGTVKEIGVGPLEIEQLDQRLPHAAVREKIAARVENQRLKQLRLSRLYPFTNEPALSRCRKIVLRCPSAGIGLVANIVEAALERLEPGVAVTEEIETQ